MNVEAEYFLIHKRVVKYGRHSRKRRVINSYGPFGSVTELQRWASHKGVLHYSIAFNTGGTVFIPIEKP
jgi:hypothetical protein